MLDHTNQTSKHRINISYSLKRMHSMINQKDYNLKVQQFKDIKFSNFGVDCTYVNST